VKLNCVVLVDPSNAMKVKREHRWVGPTEVRTAEGLLLIENSEFRHELKWPDMTFPGFWEEGIHLHYYLPSEEYRYWELLLTTKSRPEWEGQVEIQSPVGAPMTLYTGYGGYSLYRGDRLVSESMNMNYPCTSVLCAVFGAPYEERGIRGWEEWGLDPVSRHIAAAPKSLAELESKFAQKSRAKDEQRLAAARREVEELEKKLGGK
jgi:hypothetical protein